MHDALSGIAWSGLDVLYCLAWHAFALHGWVIVIIGLVIRRVAGYRYAVHSYVSLMTG